MPKEIERKFLIQGDAWRSLGESKNYRQGYIFTQDQTTTVRIRIAGEQGYITIKGKTEGIGRDEFEYPIPLEDAEIMLETLCHKPLLEKTRYKIEHKGLIWEIDEFRGDNEGLIMAEVELEDENQAIEFPEWVTQEVTPDPRYYNINLAQHPYRFWTT